MMGRTNHHRSALDAILEVYGHRHPAMPDRVRLLSQTILIEQAPNLHTPSQEWVHAGEAEDVHTHRAYGVYEEALQTITLDSDLRFERQRETFLHENLHAMLAITGLDTLIEGEATGLGEHVVSALSPILLAWLRDNPHAVAWLQEVQS